MKIFATLLLSAVLLPSLALADNVGGCGLGSKLFSGQKGLVPQVLAISVNGSSGQTFGVTSGTSGCTRDGVVTSQWKTAAYVGENMNKLALDMSRGEGESLKSLASLVGVSSQDNAKFNSTLKGNFAQIFTGSDVSSEQVLANIKNVLAANSALAKYSASI